MSNVGPIVSGMPTIFARANMFRNALDNVVDKDMEGSGLIHFYKYLIDEWRGLIACIALQHEKIEVKRINLTYSDGKAKDSTENLYEPKGSFGNMLFDRKPLWSNPNEVDPVPYLDVILYGGKVVGGTSPDSLFFTSVAYNLPAEASLFSKEEKDGAKTIRKFTDPLKRGIDPQSLHKLKSYVEHMIANMNKFAAFYDKVDLIDASYYGNLVGNLNSWVSEMETFATQKKIPAMEEKEIPPVSQFKPPFSIVLNYSTSIAGLNGIIYDEDSPEGAERFDPNELLLPKGSTLASIDDDGNPDYLNGKPLLLLRAEIKGESKMYAHFMLPISPKGIRVFGKNLGTVLGLNQGANIKTRLTAVYDPESNGENLSVKLSLYTQERKLQDVKMDYKTTKEDVLGQDLLIWPNFASRKWNKYFLYSEMPHNGSKWQATPFCANKNSENFELIMSSSDESKLGLLAKDGKELAPELAKLMVDYSITKTSGTNYEYEIYESKEPIAGFQLSLSNKPVGIAIIEYGNKLLERKDQLGDLKDAHLGVDFGSTNSAIAYRVGETGSALGFQFTNRRVSLLSSDDKDNNIRPAGEDEVFFFQNDEIQSNAIKSVLAIHDTNRMRQDKEHQNLPALAGQYVKGGFPCFEKNLPIEDSTESTYKLNFGEGKGSIGQATLIHNMKWSNETGNHDLETSHRKAYLGSLLLQVYADLFDKGIYPKSLKWSYPSAMGDNLISSYSAIWDSLEDVNPISDAKYKLSVHKGVGNFQYDQDSDDWGGSDSGNSAWGSNGAESKEDNSGWGDTPDSDSSGWGSQPTESTSNASSSPGWGDKKQVGSANKEITIDNSPMDFDFEAISDGYALTESCAVANFLAQKNGEISKSPDALTICFDIGGSTTDILVLGQMKQGGLSMIKQSSIRFAAQRVSQATKYSPNFRSVLIQLLDKKGLTLQGINKGESKYTSNTAPYYFEQLVDRLEEEEFDELYRLLGANCKEMVAVNLYVTGLIVYYAGQLAKKVKTEIDQSPDKHPGWMNPKIQLQFTGKGSRIMDWLKAINPQASQKYYMDLFIMGFGGMESAKKHLGGPPKFQERGTSSLSQDVKYEVAKGLASSAGNLYIPKPGSRPMEVIGEDGFVVLRSNGENLELDSEASITPELIEALGGMFLHRPVDANQPCPRFMQFASVYFQIATKYFGLKATQNDFLQGFQNMNIADYVMQMKEVKEAKAAKKFDFVAPIIILEGMQFYEKVILKKIGGQ
jgi:hypothetical protein